MTGKQQLFCEYYLGSANANATEAARLAGYASPEQEGSRLLKSAQIQAVIHKRVEAVAMQTDRLLVLLSEQAEGSMADFISFDAKGKPQIDLQKASAAGKLHLIRKIGKRFSEWEVELYDAQGALAQLARYHGLGSDRVEFTKNQKVIIEYVRDWDGI